MPADVVEETKHRQPFYRKSTLCLDESDSEKEDDEISSGDKIKFFDKDMELEMGWAVNQIKRNSSQVRHK